jgi:hypothetical protein
MQRIFSTFLFWTLILCACSTGAASPAAVSPSPTQTSLPLPTTAVPLESQECGYQWANKALPELSSSFQGSIQALQPEAQANAYAFGENCIRSDGSVADFLAMETDFNISLQVDDLANESVLGKWIVQVMKIIENIPAEQIAGRRPGRVSIVFQSSTAQDVINFYINQYRELPPGLNYAEIYETLKSLQ